MAGVIQRILQWLRAGYPQGIPQQDYIALFGVLSRHLTDDEVEQIALDLHHGEGGIDGNIPEERISRVIRESLHQTPSEDDVRRVSSRLALGGWPLTEPEALARD